jgi:hypothetical protein
VKVAAKHAYDHLSTASRHAPLRVTVFGLALLVLAGCGAINLVATSNIPTPLVSKVPVTVALHIPQEFAAYVHKEERWSTDWNVDLGKAQAEGITRLMSAMFEHVVVVESVNAGAQAGGDVKAILEPSVEEYAFVTPRDAGSPFFAVSIKYRVNIYSPDGRLADSWGFTGYGTSPSSGLSSSAPLATATALAMRDAGAKLAVEFREQAIVRGLMPDAQPASAPTPEVEEPAPATPATTPSDVPSDAPSEAPSDSPSDTPTDKGPAPSEGASPPEAQPGVTPNTQALAFSKRPN